MKHATYKWNATTLVGLIQKLAVSYVNRSGRIPSLHL